jgi:hypothetical protein
MGSSAHKKPKAGTDTIRNFLVSHSGFDTSVETISEFVSAVQQITERWQRADWLDRETNESYVLNNTRLVGQVWFRGHRNSSHSLRPGLYRESTKASLIKQIGSPQPTVNSDSELFHELFNLEHDQRIDFTSYGHLLNESNYAKSAIDWYFLMQHHGIPTRLLDWSTSALAALFFALDEYREYLQLYERLGMRITKKNRPATDVAVWMLDAYWLADKVDNDWVAPLLPWSEDAEKYVPKLERMIDKGDEALALIPIHSMPIEPPAMHPRVAAQEGRFIIFGKTQDLLDERIRLYRKEELRMRQVRFKVTDVHSSLRELAQLGVSRRTLFPDLAGLADFVRWKHFHKVQAYND